LTNDTKKKSIRAYIFYTLIIAVILSVIAPSIEQFIPQDNRFFDFQMFTMIIIGMIIAIFFSTIVPRLKKRGKL